MLVLLVFGYGETKTRRQLLLKYGLLLTVARGVGKPCHTGPQGWSGGRSEGERWEILMKFLWQEMSEAR